MLIGRFLNVYLCSLISNTTRQENLINTKKQFFLWFAGVRGAMAFALALKSKSDFVSVGPIFLGCTLITTSFTIVYSAFFLDMTLKKCELINICEADNFEESAFRQRRCFEAFKCKIEEINRNYLMKCVQREIKDEHSNLQMEEIKDGKHSLSNKIELGHSPNLQNVDRAQKNASEDVTIVNKRNIKVKNLHLFE